MDLQKLQKEIAHWAYKIFPSRNFIDVSLEVTKELGRLSEKALEQVVPVLHAIRQVGKLHNSILHNVHDTTKHHDEKMKNAIGNITFYLIDLCILKGWDYEKILKDAWTEIQQRDWIDDPSNGLKRYEGQDE